MKSILNIIINRHNFGNCITVKGRKNILRIFVKSHCSADSPFQFIVIPFVLEDALQFCFLC